MARHILYQYFHFNQYDNSWEEHVREDGVQSSTILDKNRRRVRTDMLHQAGDSSRRGPLSSSSPAASQSISRCGSDAATPRTSIDGASSEVVQNMFDSPAATSEMNETGEK